MIFIGVCKSNQECIKLRNCPYTKKLLTRVLFSTNRAEKNKMIAEMRKLVCNPSTRSVCCDIEGSVEDEESQNRVTNTLSKYVHCKCTFYSLLRSAE